MIIMRIHALVHDLVHHMFVHHWYIKYITSTSAHNLMSFIQIDMILVLLDSEFFILSIYAMII